MRELKDRLQALELIRAPDLRDRIRGWEPRAPRPQPPLQRLGVALFALVVAASGIAFAIQAFRPTERTTQPATTIENGRIAFSVGPDADIYVVGPDGTGLTKLVARHAEGHSGGVQMAWSPDGTRLAFTDYRPDDSVGLYVMDAEGGIPVDISSRLGDADSPTWSPDGTELAFGGYGDAGYDIYVIGANGTGLRRITDEDERNGVDGAFMPAWSPDGAKIAYSVTRYDEGSESETRGISIMNADGSDPFFITWSPNIDESPVWSPDATKIAFLRKTQFGDGWADVFVASAVGGLTEPTRLSSPRVRLTSLPTWAPDSQEVLLSAQSVDDDYGIYIASAIGTGERVVLEDAYASGAVWSPDGRWIAFVRDDAGSGLQAIWLMRPDGTGLTELAIGLEEVGGIDWQPLPVPPDATETSRPTPTSSFPLTYREGENEVMPIAFLNGTTVEMVYPSDLPLEQVVIQPTGSLYDGVLDFSLDGLTSNFVVWRSPVEGVEPIETYDPPLGGIVRRWQAVPADDEALKLGPLADGQAVRLGPWLVDIPYETLTDEQREAFLDHLFGLETEGGFLILEATPPLSLWEHEGGELVTQIYFDVDDLEILDRCIDFSQAADETFMRNGIRVFRIIEGAAVGVDVLMWCDRTGEFGLQVDEGPVADALIDGLSFRNVER